MRTCALAFESLGCISVGLKTSWFNHASRAAIARLGARLDSLDASRVAKLKRARRRR